MKSLQASVPVVMLLLWIALPPTSNCQKRPVSDKASVPSSYKLLAVKISGTTRYSDKEILAASGLQIGENVAEGDFKEATRRLGASGLFRDIVYTFSYTDAGVKLDFQLTDTPAIKLVPARFENIVWFTDAELLAAIHHRVPLFKELLPVNGTLPDQVTEALQVILTERNLPGRIAFAPEGKPDGGDLIAFVYRAEEVSIRIRDVEFPGASPEQAAFLAQATHRLTGAEYARSSLAAVARLDLMPLYLERGYLKAAFRPSDARLVNQPAQQSDSSPQTEIEVDVLLPVTPGKLYLVSGVAWKGSSVVKVEEASPLFHLIVGQPANAVLLARDAESLIKLYHSRGYMTAQITPDAQMDDDKSTVQYVMNVTEGDQYKMGELEILGLDTPSHDRLREAWKLREGEPYNADYVHKFLDDTVRLLPRGAQYSIKINEELEAKDKTVDVTLHFKMQ